MRIIETDIYEDHFVQQKINDNLKQLYIFVLFLYICISGEEHLTAIDLDLSEATKEKRERLHLSSLSHI